jgi:hypothetical protein
MKSRFGDIASTFYALSIFEKNAPRWGNKLNMKKETKPIIAQTMVAASSMLKLPDWIVREAKKAGCLAFKNSGRVDVNELDRWIQNEWHGMPSQVFLYFRQKWLVETMPNLVGHLGVAKDIEEASRRTGLSVSMIMYLRDAGSPAFIE